LLRVILLVESRHMPNDPREALVRVTDASGQVTGVMDRATADYLASRAPDPTQSSLNALLSTVTRVRVVPVENYRHGATEQRTLLDTSDPESLASLRRCFEIVEGPETFGHCMCLGEPHIELYAGDTLAATIGYHHRVAIRWAAWKHDACLKEPDRLLDWMSAHGVDGPRREVEAMRRRDEEAQRRAEQWLGAMPDSLHPFWDQMGHHLDRALHRQLLEALRVAVPAPAEQALVLFGWFGSGAGPWSGFPSYESVPEQLLLHYPTWLLIDVLTGSAPTDPQWRGAARYFGGWEFRQTKKGDGALLPVELKQRLLAAARTTGISDNIERAERAFNG
jgi:hypothetical protein